MKTKLSVNLNKIALLRNARGSNYPSLKDFANRAIDCGVDGLTLHVRPDQRHATCKDAYTVSELCKSNNIEFNLEGNPFSLKKGNFEGFENLARNTNPEQVTLVPDEEKQITSNHGWKNGAHDEELTKIIERLKIQHRVSIFIDPNIDCVDYATSMYSDAVEIYTGPYAKSFKAKEYKNQIEDIKSVSQYAKSKGLLVNAGHDLNLENISKLVETNLIDEVSIGHAITVDSLNFGFETTLSKYIKLIKG